MEENFILSKPLIMGQKKYFKPMLVLKIIIRLINFKLLGKLSD